MSNFQRDGADLQPGHDCTAEATSAFLRAVKCASILSVHDERWSGVLTKAHGIHECAGSEYEERQRLMAVMYVQVLSMRSACVSSMPSCTPGPPGPARGGSRGSQEGMERMQSWLQRTCCRVQVWKFPPHEILQPCSMRTGRILEVLTTLTAFPDVHAASMLHCCLLRISNDCGHSWILCGGSQLFSTRVLQALHADS